MLFEFHDALLLSLDGFFLDKIMQGNIIMKI